MSFSFAERFVHLQGLPKGLTSGYNLAFARYLQGALSSLNHPVYNFPRKLFSYILIQLMIAS